jgi:transglutaminase superfamily protein
MQGIIYTDPNDLFLTGVMDARRGTCASLTALYIALAWRMRWPVSLATADYHLICRYDDGKVIHNIEVSSLGSGGFKSPADDYYMQQYRLPIKAVRCGSELRCVTPREMLGLFVDFRGRHLENVGKSFLGEADYLLARYLFPRNRHLHYAQGMASVQTGMDLFEEGEVGHPKETAAWVRHAFGPGSMDQMESANAIVEQANYTYDESGRIQ